MTKPIETITLWVASVGNGYGVDLYVAVSEDALRNEIFHYVKEWWHEELGDDKPMPQDRDKAIEEYFEHIDAEACTIAPTLLAGDLFHAMPAGKVSTGYMDIGEWDPVLEQFPWEGHVDLMVGPGGRVWAKVGDVDNLPSAEAE